MTIQKGGACGYGNLHESGYGLATAALSSVMFNNGKGCGTCYELKCVNSKWCQSNAPSIKITATNLCPPNWYKPTDNGGWCNPPRSHFDLSKPMFMKIAQVRGGIVPVNYKRYNIYLLNHSYFRPREDIWVKLYGFRIEFAIIRVCISINLIGSEWINNIDIKSLTRHR